MAMFNARATRKRTLIRVACTRPIRPALTSKHESKSEEGDGTHLSLQVEKMMEGVVRQANLRI